MVQGPLLLVILFISILFIIYMTARVKMHPFVVLLLASFGVGIAARMPLEDVVKSISSGFGSTLGYIGIVIIAGTIIGTILEKTGAAISMANFMLRLVGRKNVPLAMSATGYVVSVPVFCDSGYIILTPLNKALARSTGRSMAVMAVALATGLYGTHCLVPPTPGPIAAAGILHADLGRLIILGLLCSIPGVILGYLWAVTYAKRYTIEPKTEETYEELMARYGQLPGTLSSFLPLVVPIVLIALKSVAAFPTHPFGTGGFQTFLSFIGNPVTALLIGVFLALGLVPRWNQEVLGEWLGTGIKNAAVILAITGAGGSFGTILKATPIGEYLGSTLAVLGIGIVLPFVIAAALKTAQGSSTVAIITTSSLVAPMLASLGLAAGWGPILVVLAIGAGSMTVSHANDSYFWVVSQFSDMEVSIAYRVFTAATLIQGLASIAMVALVAMWLL